MPDQPPAPFAQTGAASVRVVTVAFNPGEELDRFLDTLHGASTRHAVSAVVVDNGSEQAADMDRSFIDYTTHDLTAWLEGILETA